MSVLYICNEPNPLLRQGAYYEDNEDGFVQEVRVFNENGRLVLDGWKGMALPTSMVRKHLIRIQRTGVDPNVRRQLALEVY